jgi:hypothetical protein
LSCTISSHGAQYVTPQKYFSHPSSVIYSFFFNPTHKTESGIANRCEITNSKPPGPIIMMGQSETLTSNQIIFVTLFGYRSERKVDSRLQPGGTYCLNMAISCQKILQNIWQLWHIIFTKNPLYELH